MKALIIKNDISDQTTLENGLNLVKADFLSINFPVEFTEIVLNKSLTSLPFSNEVNIHGHYVDPNSFLGTWDIGYDTVCLVYDWTKVIPQPTNPFDNGPAMQIPVQWYTTYPRVFADYYEHETCHNLAKLTGKTDLTHLMVNRNLNPSLYDQFAQKQPSEFYLYLIKYYMQFMTPTAIITRDPDNGIETLGDIQVGTIFSKVTLERPWKNNIANISCIPKGKYLCKWKFKLNSLAFHYQVMNVPNRTGIFIHSGNYFFDSVGCILLGTGYANINNDKETDIINSRITIQAFETLMNKKDFTLIIQ